MIRHEKKYGDPRKMKHMLSDGLDSGQGIKQPRKHVGWQTTNCEKCNTLNTRNPMTSTHTCV